jgi:hypothetical protein
MGGQREAFPLAGAPNSGRSKAMTLRRWRPGLLTFLVAASLLAWAMSGPAAAMAAPRSLPPHQVHCALADGHLYLGSAGAARHHRTVTCAIRLYQLSPDADGVIITLARAHQRNSYSVVLEHLSAPPTGRTLIPWLSHPGPAKLHCTLVDGHLYLGSPGAGHSRHTVTCIVRLYQLVPHADGVILTLRTARHHRAFSIAIKHLPLRPTGRTLLRWVA